MMTPQVCACSVAAPRAQLCVFPRSCQLAVTRQFALSLSWQRLWFAALWWQRIKLCLEFSRQRVNFAVSRISVMFYYTPRAPVPRVLQR